MMCSDLCATAARVAFALLAVYSLQTNPFTAANSGFVPRSFDLDPVLSDPLSSLPGYDSIAIDPFGVLVATGIFVGASLTGRRGHSLGLTTRCSKTMILLVGVYRLHVPTYCDVLFYQDHRDQLVAGDGPRRPALRPLVHVRLRRGGARLLLVVSQQPGTNHAVCRLAGLSALPSGGCLAAWAASSPTIIRKPDQPRVVQLPRRRLPVWRVAYCLLDRSKGWIVTAANSDPNFRRYDMGFFEVLVAGALATFYSIAEQFKPRCGFFVAAIALYYGPVLVFILDYLRVKGGGARPALALANASLGPTSCPGCGGAVSAAGYSSLSASAKNRRSTLPTNPRLPARLRVFFPTCPAHTRGIEKPLFVLRAQHGTCAGLWPDLCP